MRTKIDERREREAYDKAHPWQSMPEAIINDGVVCELLFSDMVTTDKRYFLGDDDRWYQIDPPSQMNNSHGWWNGRIPMNWRSADPWRKIVPAKRAEVMRRANARSW